MGKEILLTIRILAFNATFIFVVYIMAGVFKAPEIGQVVIKLPNECAKTMNVKGKEFINYECFRYLTTAKIEREIEL